MVYDFSKLFKDAENILEEFIDKYTTYCLLSKDDDKNLRLHVSYYKNIIKTICARFEEEQLLEQFELLAKLQISSDAHYIVIADEINNLKNILINKIDKNSINSNFADLFQLFNNIYNKVASVYLQEYASNLKLTNNVRISSLSDLMEKNILVHYESHLVWLSNLADCINNKNITNFPELDSTMCNFGKWLHDEGKKIIQNNSKYNTIVNMHNTLHLFAKKISSNISTQEDRVIITYLEKCEMLSLSIGTELALIDNILMNNKVIKDPLTNALNRHSLKNIFKNQYELSMATSNPFILAMCDLDDFKTINDTYGHLFGDKVLIHFVEIVKKNIRNSDIIIRYGGEEFVIMLPAIGKERGLAVLEKIRKDFYDNFLEIDNKAVQHSVSIGFVEVTPQIHYKQHFLDDYIGVADQKLYSAKHNGRNRIEHC
ncbi:sensor domain-containing diguanylate cyclase [Sulfurimonas sp.]|uniref:sensor domain-containing diguanylate cyclase n=1 Tax=Sulfurimonas sp. TaxID=2022749 RepID=UPI00260F786D|nr:sensor domain-containing diguanylate cyclase [Sulfurimonas sp.]